MGYRFHDNAGGEEWHQDKWYPDLIPPRGPARGSPPLDPGEQLAHLFMEEGFQ